MRERGAITIAQHKDSAVVYGMPREAVRLGAARYILNPDEIAFIVGQL
jgi:two-component system chemotaxis response regulator CheB